MRQSNPQFRWRSNRRERGLGKVVAARYSCAMRITSAIKFLLPSRSPAQPQPNTAGSTHRTEWLFLAGLLCLAFALRLAVAAMIPNIHHADELYQYLEQGHRLAFGYGVTPWEYRDGTRFWLLPGLIGGLMAAVDWIGGGPKAYLTVLHAVLAALSLSIIAVAWLFARRLSGKTAAWLAATFTTVWFELIYFAAKPLTEAVAASTLICGAFLICHGDGRRPGIAVTGGILLGLTFLLRIQLSPALLFLGVIAFYRLPRRNALLAAATATVIVIAGGLLDWATWGLPFQSLWSNVTVNLVEGKAAQFGVSPWYYYAAFYYRYWTVIGLPLGLLILAGAWRAPYLFAIGAIIVLSHSAIGHKEYRFIFPALPFFVLLAALGTAALLDTLRRVWPHIWKGAAIATAVLLWTGISINLAARDRIRPVWTQSAAEIAAFTDLHRIKPLCALGVIGRSWNLLPGYTYLHRDVPLYVFETTVAWKSYRKAFNIALARPAARLEQAGYQRSACYGGGQLCIYRRAGGCTAVPSLMINQMLIDRNQ